MGLLGHDIHCIVNSIWSKRMQWNNLQTRLSAHKDVLNENHFTMKQIQQPSGKISFVCKRKILICRLTDHVQDSKKASTFYILNRLLYMGSIQSTMWRWALPTRLNRESASIPDSQCVFSKEATGYICCLLCQIWVWHSALCWPPLYLIKAGKRTHCKKE